MTRRIMAEGRVINGKLYSKGKPIDLSAEDEKALDLKGLLEPTEEAKAEAEEQANAEAEAKAEAEAAAEAEAQAAAAKAKPATKAGGKA